MFGVCAADGHGHGRRICCVLPTAAILGLLLDGVEETHLGESEEGCDKGGADEESVKSSEERERKQDG